MTSRFPVADKRDRFVDGILFDSKKEAERYKELKLLERAGIICDILIQPAYPVLIMGKHFCTYTADFSYLDKRCGRVVEDTKSTGTAMDAAYRLRKKAAELYYGIKITEVIR